MEAARPYFAPELETIVVERRGPSAEVPVEDEDLRPELAAESFTKRMRLGLGLLTLAAVVMPVLGVAAALAWPEGAHLAAGGVPFFAATLGISWTVVVVYGALLTNNAALARGEHRLWLGVFFLTGPVGMLAYWAFHVWPARYVPRHSTD